MIEKVFNNEDVNLSLKERVIYIEGAMIEDFLRNQSKQNKSQAAREMGISREALRKKLIRYNEIKKKVEIMEEEVEANSPQLKLL